MKLIDKAIEQYKGVWPKFNWSSTIKNKNAILLVLKKHEEDSYEVGGLVLGGTSANPIYSQIVCIKEEFEKRARELGWINGYKYGVEYTTNGKRPELADDVDIECFDGLRWWGAVDGLRAEDLDFNTHVTQKFRIVDERYKPKDTESQTKPKDCVSKNDNQENSWYDRGEFPPVGVECEAVIDGQKYEACTVIAYFDDMVWLSVRNEKHPVRIADKCKFRPLKSPKEKAVENALEILSSVWDDPKDELVHVLETLFDAELLK